jgi:hypothetical protein
VRAMGQLRTDIGKKDLVEKDILVKMPYCPRGGILSAHLVRESHAIIKLLRLKHSPSWRKQTSS